MEVTVRLEHVMCMSALEVVVFLVRVRDLDEGQIRLVHHRPQTRLDTHEGHGLRSMEIGVNYSGDRHDRVCHVVLCEFVILVERDQDVELSLSLEVVEKSTLEPITHVCVSRKSTSFTPLETVTHFGYPVMYEDIGAFPSHLQNVCE